ncbi:MAG TPA: MFS transporter [Pseudonocardiaceae bacterium]|jgi:MFS family permease|nr:MFS transporter [Pseudonocardiaceae bacterium]
MRVGARSETQGAGAKIGAQRRSAFAFWTVTATIGVVLAANSTPTPLYVDYQQRWGFTSTTLTAIFATYSGGILVTLLLAGGLSDRIGRRPVLLVGLAVLIASYAVFLFADGVVWLYFARALQGLATGLFTGAAGAALVDLHPRSDHRTAGLVNSTSMPTGLAVGATLCGALAEWGPMPLRTPYLVIAALSLVLLAAIALYVPETVPDPSRGWGSLIYLQRLGVPVEIRGQFIIACLGVTAAWSVGGLYLGLGGSLAKELLQGNNHFITGLVILSMQGVAGLAQLMWNLRWSSVSNTVASVAGCAALLMGMPVVALSLLVGSPAVFFVGAVVTGVGFGLAFMGSTRRVTQMAPAARRGGTLAAYFVVAYLAFSIPVVAAGFLTTRIGLSRTFYLFAAVIAVVSAITMVRTLATRGLGDQRRGRPDPT